ncbi:MAG TPA: YtxH domain-containing protein [Candidatus Saccharimonadales bacterium]|nr:YtxH domain-containing protein [Candidatus Saccharimonadales bacterium]
MKDSTKKLALGAVIAGAVGYVAGILTAPKSGKETRKDIKDKAGQVLAEAEKRLKQLHTELASLLKEGHGMLDKLSGKARAELEKAMTTATTVKEKARELLSAAHEGTAEDKDLEKAVKEANKAVEHLKTYLKKR